MTEYITTQTNIITQTTITKPKLSKAERKAIHDAKEKAKIDALIANRKKHMFEFTDKQKATGDFTKSFYDYYLCDHKTFKLMTNGERDDIFANKFPVQFQKTSYPDIFDLTHWIGIDVNDLTYKTKHVYPDGFSTECIANYDDCNEKEKIEFERHVNELGERSNSQLMVFHKDHPDKIYSVKINIWRSPTESFDYWFRIQYRPNRIYLTDYDGFKVFDFELNRLFFKSVSELEPGDVYGFEVDPENWNQVRIWSMKKARTPRVEPEKNVESENDEPTYVYRLDHDLEVNNEYRDYNDIKGIESIAELVVT